MLHNFARVYVVNLDSRPDRWETFEERVPADWPFQPVVRYEAIDGRLAPPPGWWKVGAGAWGCYRTHLKIIEECLTRDIDSVLILEDDALFADDFAAKCQTFFSHLPNDWGYVYLGGQHIEQHIRLPRQVNEWVYRPYNVNRLHAYGLRGRNLGRLLAALRPVLLGWVSYYRKSEVRAAFEQLDQWIRRKLRAILWRQWKRPWPRAKAMARRGLPWQRAWVSATNGRGPWWNAGASHMNQAVPTRQLRQLGLVSLLDESQRSVRSN